MHILVLIIVILILLLKVANTTNPKEININEFTGITKDEKSYTGYIEIKQSKIFYWFVPNQEKGTNAPLLIWLNGGPGCSSMVGAFTENGPVFYDQYNNNLKLNEHSWHKKVNMLYIDNPIGVGYSKGVKSEMPTSAKIATEKLYTEFLKEWVKKKINGEKIFKETQPVYIFGESYGGKYTVVLANLIKNDINTPFKNLKGIGLGDSFIAPALQNKYNPRTGYQVGILNNHQYILAADSQVNCVNEVEDAEENGLPPPAMKCLKTWSMFVKGKLENKSSVTFTNGYDYRKHSSYPMLNKDSTFLKKMQGEFGTVLGATNPEEFAICNSDIWTKMKQDFEASYLEYIPPLLDQHNVSILVYNGQFDMRANVVGTNSWLRYLKWSGQGGFLDTAQTVFKVKEESKGLIRAHKNLYQMVIYNSGHMVPMDQPEASLQMISQFVDNTLCNTCVSVKCPMKCSKHDSIHKCGEKTNHECVCDKHFKGDSCNHYQNENFLLGDVAEFAHSYIPGFMTQTYDLGFAKVVNDDNIDVYIELNIETVEDINAGRLFVFLHTGDQFENVKESLYSMQHTFPYHSLSSERIIKFSVNELNRKENHHLSVVVWNDSPHNTQYTIKIHPRVSGLKFNPVYLVSYIVFGLIFAATVILFIIFVAQYIFSKALYSFKFRRAR